jgi:hypothetical protein
MDSSLFKRAHVQEHIRSVLIWANKSEAPIGIPPYQRAEGHDARGFVVICLLRELHATTFPRGGELSNRLIGRPIGSMIGRNCNDDWRNLRPISRRGRSLGSGPCQETLRSNLTV